MLLPHTNQLNQYIVGKERSPINDGNDSPQYFFLTVYCGTVLHVTLMYVKEPKEIVTGKFFHYQHVSEQNSLTAGEGMPVFRLEEGSRTTRTRCADGTPFRGPTVEA